LLNFKKSLGRWADPLATVAIFIGVVSWFIASYSQIEGNQDSLKSLKEEVRILRSETHDTDHKIEDKILDQSKRLGRIEGKLDIIIDVIVKK